jgi:hypothetical protein
VNSPPSKGLGFRLTAQSSKAGFSGPPVDSCDAFEISTLSLFEPNKRMRCNRFKYEQGCDPKRNSGSRPDPGERCGVCRSPIGNSKGCSVMQSTWYGRRVAKDRLDALDRRVSAIQTKARLGDPAKACRWTRPRSTLPAGVSGGLNPPLFGADGVTSS